MFKKFLLLITAAAVSLSIQAQGPVRQITIDDGTMTVRQLLDEVERQSGLSFAYDNSDVDLGAVVRAKANKEDVLPFLDRVLAAQNLKAQLDGARIYLKKVAEVAPVVPQKPKSLAGTVKDAAGTPLIGAAVLVQGTQTYAITDLDGAFSIKSPGAPFTLEVSLLGFRTETVPCSPDLATITIVLQEETTFLEESVVVGYGSQRRELITNSIAKFKPGDDNLRQALSPSEMLQGRVAGMTVSTQSGNLGTAERVSIRGSASLNASNEPLYVVDGIPLNNSAGSLYSYGEDLSSLSVLNLSDIESIEVLKDAASAAIYGSRATNGVILITTKSGRDGKAETKVSYNAGVNMFPRKDRVRYTDSATWVQVYNAGIDNYNAQMGYVLGDAGYVAHIMNPYEGLPDTDWLGLITRPGIFHNVDASFSGGNKKTKYYIGGSYRTEEGVIKTNDIQKGNLKVNVSTEMNKWLTVGSNLSGNFIKTNRVPGANLGSTALARAVEQRPFDRPYKPDGSYYLGGTSELSRHNPVQLMTESTSYVNNYRFLGSVYTDIHPLEGLNIKVSYSTDASYTLDYIYYNANHPYCEDNGRIIEKNRFFISNLLETFANYQHKFGDFDFNAMAGHSFQKTVNRNNSMDVQNFPATSFDTVGSAAVFSGVSGGIGEYAIESWFARSGVAWKDRYVLTATVRADGSSRFSPKHRWGLFPSVSAGWNISKEPFWKWSATDLKLRASYGKTGNQDGISNYGWQASISSGSNYDGVSGIAVSSSGNENLTWETADQYDVGFDLSFWKGRLGIIFDAYLKNTYNLLYSKPMASTTGFTSLTSNIGSMRNFGFELTLDGHADLGPVKWDSSLNISHNTNELTSLLNKEIISLNNYHALQVGKEVGAFYLYQFDGIYQYDGEVPDPQYELGVRAGDVKYHDFDGNGIINDKDRIIVGSPNPILSGGWSNTFKCKGVELGVFLTYSLGNEVYALWMQGPTRLGNYQGLLDEWAKHYWTGPGSTNTYQRPIYSLHGQNVQSSTNYLKDGSNIRLASLSLGYSLPASVIEKLNVKGLRVYLQGENLAILSRYPGWDPDTSTSVDPSLIGVDNYGVPRATVCKLGVTLTF
ncbi:MAG: TonB-dependent receptor [Bacteroidales bacterium]|nr:TonB-dependent receptor [Bacteroidales bacterium]